MNNVMTIILAGGRGERLYPLTKDRAKPAVPFGGIYRIIDFTLSNCLNSHVRKINVFTQYKSISLDRHIKLGWNIFNNELGEYINVIPPQQRTSENWYMGTADAIYQNIYSIEAERPEHVMILSGDHIYKMNYEMMFRFHVEKNADVTVGGIEFDVAKAARQFGILEINEDRRIIGFEEKPEHPKTIPGSPDKALSSMGIYIFKTDKLMRAVIEDTKKDSAHDFGKNIIPGMFKKDRVFAYLFVDENKKEVKYWRDIGTLDAYWEANMDLIEVTPVFNMYDKEWPLRTYQEQHPPAKTVFAQEHKGGRVGAALDSIISAGCIISGGKVQRSILSPEVRVNSYSNVFQSILMEGVNIGRHAKIKNAIIDKGVSIPEYAEIGYDLEKDRKHYTVTDSGIVVIPKGATVENDK
ncbi:MAG TPA: glucose-1-phosphate adenylyltransferase [bacterium]|nr:glucose-1-phosphate adenylyltransferase [bacterium]